MTEPIDNDQSVKICTLGEGSFLSNSIAEGSAIAVEPRENGFVLWYEGDIYNSGMTFEEKAKHAAGRMFQRYPTVAKHFISEDRYADANLVEVGEMSRDYKYIPNRPTPKI